MISKNVPRLSIRVSVEAKVHVRCRVGGALHLTRGFNLRVRPYSQ